MGVTAEDEQLEKETLLRDRPLALARTPSRSRDLCLGGAWLLSLVCTALFIRSPSVGSERAELLPTKGNLYDLDYLAWPPPRAARSAEAMRAIGFGVRSPGRVDAESIGRKLVALGRARAPDGEAAVLVIAGCLTGLGLGNTFCGLTAAAVLAEALGGAPAW